MNLTRDQLDLLEKFTNYCRDNPQIFHAPNLCFFKEFMEYFGAQIPPLLKPENGSNEPAEPEEQNYEEPMDFETSHPTEENEDPVQSSDSEEEPVHEITALMSIEEEPVLPFVPFHEDEEISEEMCDESFDKASEANAAAKSQEWEKAVQLYTEALNCNPTVASLYAKRAYALLNLSRPKASISDCDNALLINPDCTLAYKYRGRAKRCILQLEEAARDLEIACNVDFDEQTDAWLREISQCVREMRQYKQRKQLRTQRKDLEARKRRAAKAREENERQQREDGDQFTSDFGNEGMPGMGNLSDILKDPELMEAMKDPEILAALMAMQKDPSSLYKYQSNPKVKEFMEKFSKKFGGPGS